MTSLARELAAPRINLSSHPPPSNAFWRLVVALVVVIHFCECKHAASRASSSPSPPPPVSICCLAYVMRYFGLGLKKLCVLYCCSPSFMLRSNFISPSGTATTTSCRWLKLSTAASRTALATMEGCACTATCCRAELGFDAFVQASVS